jgi:hypothetical protein
MKFFVLGSMLTSKKRFAFPIIPTRSPYPQRYMMPSTKTHITHRLLGAPAKICRRSRCGHTPPSRHYLRRRLPMISTTFSITDGHLSLRQHDTIPLHNQRLPGWGLYLTCLHIVGVPRRQYQRLPPGDDILPVLQACNTNWNMAQDRLVVR